MSCTRKEIIEKASSWVGLGESDGTHKQIIDIYNSHNPHPRGYKLQYNDAWCAGTASALAIACNATDIIPVECSCTMLIELAQKMGIWVENDAHIPQEGDFVIYDWQDKEPEEDNKGKPNHIGIVEFCVGDSITVIEGNFQNAVGRRLIKVNGKYIRGFITPHYDEEKPVVVEEETPVVETPAEEKPVEQTEPECEKCSLFSLIIRAILKLLKGG